LLRRPAVADELFSMSRKMDNMQAYICGPLLSSTNLPKARDFYSFLGNVCQEMGFEPYLPHTQTDPILNPKLSPTEVFEKDHFALSRSNIVVAHIGIASLGVGAELGIAFHLGIPVIALYRRDESPSRFVLGMLANMPKSEVISFRDKRDCESLLRNALINQHQSQK
jgi:nucleoside 2-deoxyribosyltransferase